MRRLVSWLAGFSAAIMATLPSAEAAKITAESAGGTPVILVLGDLEFGDERKFIDAALTSPDAIVVFDSPGGSLVAGIEIGRAIRLKGYNTLVIEGSTCASACALAWLGGRKRVMGPNARIGFHAAFTDESAGRSVNGAGNALVGAYLNQLGVPSAAVVYLTAASPDGMTWLSAADARKVGLEIDVLEPDAKPRLETKPERAGPVPPTVRPAGREMEITVPARPPPIDWTAQGEWVQVASRASLSDAIDVANVVRRKNANIGVFQANNGWHAVAVGPFSPTRGRVALAALLQAREIPSDSIVTRGATYASLEWGNPIPRVLPPADVTTLSPADNATTLVDRYYRAWSGPSRAALGFINGAYDADVMYYGARRPRIAVLEDKARSKSAWPDRRYMVRPETVSVQCDLRRPNDCTVTGLVDRMTPAGGSSRQSAALLSFIFEVRSYPSGPRIFSESMREMPR